MVDEKHKMVYVIDCKQKIPCTFCLLYILTKTFSGGMDWACQETNQLYKALILPPQYFFFHFIRMSEFSIRMVSLQRLISRSEIYSSPMSTSISMCQEIAPFWTDLRLNKDCFQKSYNACFIPYWPKNI